MDRYMTVEEKIKRAEDVYRRKNTGIRVSTNYKKDFKLFNKMLKQLFICILIYCSYYIVKENQNILPQGAREKLEQVLSYDINLEEVYQTSSEYLTKMFTNNQEKIEEDTNNILENQTNEGEIENNVTDLEYPEEAEKVEAVVGEGVKELIEGTLAIKEFLPKAESSFNQIRVDAEYVKANVEMKIPLKGTITSRFGVRTPTTKTVPTYHSGIDIAANKKTKFVAAMEGTVTKVSSYGDFGNHFVVTNGNITTLYAHCHKIYVKEGDKVSLWQEIGEVGSTGNSTGPHLHFEIQVEGRLVNPEYILDL